MEINMRQITPRIIEEEKMSFRGFNFKVKKKKCIFCMSIDIFNKTVACSFAYNNNMLRNLL